MTNREASGVAAPQLTPAQYDALIDEQMKRTDLTDHQVLVLVLARAYLGEQPHSKPRHERKRKPMEAQA